MPTEMLRAKMMLTMLSILGEIKPPTHLLGYVTNLLVVITFMKTMGMDSPKNEKVSN